MAKRKAGPKPEEPLKEEEVGDILEEVSHDLKSDDDRPEEASGPDLAQASQVEEKKVNNKLHPKFHKFQK